MPVPPIRPTAIAVYIYRKTASAARRKTEPVASARAPRPRYEFLQIRRSSSAASHHHSWQTVYGGIERKETALQAALRELKEETSLTPKRMFQVEYLECFYFRPTDSLLFMPVFAVEVSPQTKITLNHEHDAHRWILEKQIPESFMWRTTREALTYLLTHLRHPSPAAHFLEIDLPLAAKKPRD